MKVRKVVNFFDKLEDSIRARLSHYPVLYSFVGAIGIILLWKGVWEMAEEYPILHSEGSAIVGITILLLTGLMVSFFIGDNIILSGYKREKKLAEKTEQEIRADRSATEVVSAKLDAIQKELQELRELSKPKPRARKKAAPTIEPASESTL